MRLVIRTPWPKGPAGNDNALQGVFKCHHIHPMLTPQSVVTKVLPCDIYACSIRLSPGIMYLNMTGNCLSVRVDRERRGWVRRKRQRSDQLRQQKHYPSHGTIYSEALPRQTKGLSRKDRSSNRLLPSYASVSSTGQLKPWLPDSNATQQNPTQPTIPTQPMPTQAMPTLQNATQPVPVQQVTSQQSAAGMDPDIARALLQDS
jgi:hypothetical protein